MADLDPTELVTVKNPSTEETREIPRGALPFFTNNGFVALKSDGSVNPNPATPAAKKD